jgi:acetylornithine deacetylase
VPSLLSDAALLARLVAFDTTSERSNLPCADFLCDYLASAGARLDRLPSPDGAKANLVARKGPASDGERSGLVLSAHMDVVPAGEGWESDPFALTDGGDRWFGRGTADMKGFLALAVNALAAVDAATLAAPLALVLTYDEELGCLGAGHLARTWPQDDPLPRHAVIGEPTSFAAVRLHKGHLKMRVTLTGVSAHSGYPHLGVNAIEPAAGVIAALSELRRELAGERPANAGHFPETPFVALNVARIAGGTAINVVPERCTLEIGLRLLPGMEAEPTVARVKRAVAAAAPPGRFAVELLDASPPMLLAEDAPIYRALCEMVEQNGTVSASYGTDAGWLQQLGLDCVVCGPGTIAVAHKPNEFLLKADLAKGARLVRRLIDRFAAAASH